MHPLPILRSSVRLNGKGSGANQTPAPSQLPESSDRQSVRRTCSLTPIGSVPIGRPIAISERAVDFILHDAGEQYILKFEIPSDSFDRADPAQQYDTCSLSGAIGQRQGRGIQIISPIVSTTAYQIIGSGRQIDILQIRQVAEIGLLEPRIFQTDGLDVFAVGNHQPRTI